MEEREDYVSPEAQAIIDKELGVEPEVTGTIDEEPLPSDKDVEKLYANKYKSVEELKKGIENIGADLPQYVLDGMNEEALEQYYVDLNKAKSSGETKPETGRKHTLKTEEEKTEEEKAEETKKPAAVDAELWKELEEQFTSNGALTDEQYDKLNKAGIPDEVIDKYIDGIASEQERFTEKVYELAGGKEQYEEIKSWAEENLSQREIEAIGKMDYTQMLIALDGVKARYNAANAGKDTLRGKGGSTSSAGYSSEAEYLRDVSDPRYNTDTLYRERVMSKLQRSNLTS